jgi:hypothetical protein
MTHAEMLDQLGTMARQLADEAPPAVRSTTAALAEWAAQAARASRPYAQRVAEVADTASLRFADRSERFAAALREGIEPPTVDESPDQGNESAGSTGEPPVP